MPLSLNITLRNHRNVLSQPPNSLSSGDASRPPSPTHSRPTSVVRSVQHGPLVVFVLMSESVAILENQNRVKISVHPSAVQEKCFFVREYTVKPTGKCSNRMEIDRWSR